MSATFERCVPLNYRHHFHAGNFADLLKHALWLELLDRRASRGGPRRILETHAGAGVYNLSGETGLSGETRPRSHEAEAGIGALLAADAPPQWLGRLRQRVLGLNTRGELKLYPGSPALAAGSMRAGDVMTLYELRADDAAALKAALGVHFPEVAARIDVLVKDGYGHGFDGGRRLGDAVCLVDPPFETGQDAEAIVRFAARYVRAFPTSPLAIWAPLKDLESYDYILRGLEALRPDVSGDLVSAEVRLRPLWDPMRMNGCGMILLNAGLSPERGEPLELVCRWIAHACGEDGGRAVVRRLGMIR